MTPSGSTLQHVQVGWSWTTTFVALLNLMVGGGIGAAWIRARPQSQKIKADAAAQLIDDLSARVLAVEGRLETQRVYYEGKLEQERASHAADIQIMRHRMNNLDQCLTMLLMLIEQSPERAQEAAGRVREMRSKQEAAEATEKATIQHGRIVAANAAQAIPPAA